MEIVHFEDWHGKLKIFLERFYHDIFPLFCKSRFQGQIPPFRTEGWTPSDFVQRVHQFGDVFQHWPASWILVFMENVALEQLLETQGLHVGKKRVPVMTWWEMEVKNLSGCLIIPRCSCICLCWVLRDSSQGFPFGIFLDFSMYIEMSSLLRASS